MSFQVMKTINNNVVSCQDECGCEYIAMGRGLGFGVKAGQTIRREQAEKMDLEKYLGKRDWKDPSEWM